MTETEGPKSEADPSPAVRPHRAFVLGALSGPPVISMRSLPTVTGCAGFCLGQRVTEDPVSVGDAWY